MKRLVTCFLALGVLLIPAASVLAVTTGSWSLGQLHNGYWIEFSGDGGLTTEAIYPDPTSPDAYTQWSIQGSPVGQPFLTGTGSDSLGSYTKYVGSYSIDELTLNDPALFGAPDFSVGMTATNASYRYAENLLRFEFSATGVDSGLTYSVFATWHGIPPWYDEQLGLASFSFDPVLGTDGYPNNIGFDTFNITIAAVPVPAPMLLLASGLLGLAGISRKLRKN